MSKARCKKETSSMDFLKWRVYLDEHELNGFHREDYFLAQIAMYIAMANSKHPEKLSLKQFLMKFTKERQEQELTMKAKIARAMNSRVAWGMATKTDIPMDDLKGLEENDVLPFQAAE